MQSQSEPIVYPFNFTAEYQCQNNSAPSTEQQELSQQQQQLSSFMDSFFQNAQHVNDNGAGCSQASWRICRFCQQNSFITNEALADHETACHVRMNNQHLQQLLQQQQQQQQHLLQQQLQQQQTDALSQQQTQPFLGNQTTAYQLSQILPTKFSQDVTTGAGFRNQQVSAVSNQYCQGVSTENNNTKSNMNFQGQFETAIDCLPEFNPESHAHHKPSSSDEYFPLAMPEDDDWLTPLHCFVRQYCVEVFVATPDDVAAPCMGKRNPVSVNQVGIRCPFCSPERTGNTDTDIARARENGVVYPSLISRIYNATINLLQRHLRTCSFVPAEILQRYEELKSSNARSGASKKYWAESAMRLGLVDTAKGIRFVKPSSSEKEGMQPAILASPKCDSSAPPLVLPSDKRYTTAFTFHLMAQMQPCVFTEADRLGRRRGLDVGFAGLACRHCFGAYGTGRFFPSSIKTMADASKTLDVIYKHEMKCKTCPADIKVGLRNLREFHDSERSKMPFGNQRAFFTKIWGRLHEHDGNEFDSAPMPVQQQHQAPPLNSKYPGQEAQQKPAGSNNTDSIAIKLQDNSMDSLQALYAHFNTSNNQKGPTKLVNEAA